MYKTSDKVMKLNEYKDCVFYRVGCMCGSSYCDLTMEMEYDPELNSIILVFYKELIYSSWFGLIINAKLYWLRDKWQRIKGAVKLLFTGKIHLEESLILKDTKHIDAFITALQEGKQKLQPLIEE